VTKASASLASVKMQPLIWVSVPKNRKQPACRFPAFRAKLPPECMATVAFAERDALVSSGGYFELNIGKMSGLPLVLVGTAGICAAFAMQSSTPTDPPPSSLSHQGDVVKDARRARGLSLALAPEGWRAFWHSAEPSEPAETVVVVPAQGAKAAVKAPIVTARLATPASGDRDSLVRELQRELRRVGCYDRALNGAWTVSTRTAMKAFTSRVNATLPTKEPDQILLALVKGHHGRACGTCPNGQSLAHDGRCLPNSILAQTPGKAQSERSLLAADRSLAPAITHQSTAATVSPQYPGEGSMSLGGPLEEQAKPSGETQAAVVQTARPVMGAPRRQEILRRSTFGPDYFRRIDALGVN
jgi:peptidoglycan hydrolase-like protein with peptidoglycan-binding domain